jgi:hypothetical protein
MPFGLTLERPRLDALLAHVVVVAADLHWVFVRRIELLVADEALEKLVALNQVFYCGAEYVVHTAYLLF